MSYKQTIDIFITKRYEHLLQCSVNILKTNKKTILEPNELVSELVIYLYTNKVKVTEFIKINKLEGFSVSWMNIQGRHMTSQVNRKHNINNSVELDDILTNYIPSTDKDLENISETSYEKDLYNSFNEEQIVKIMKVDGVLDELTKTEMFLFKAYFIEGLSYDKIVKKYTFYREKDGKRINYKSKKTVYDLMKSLKIKIRELIQ
jgi:hypothetical protein